MAKTEGTKSKEESQASCCSSIFEKCGEMIKKMQDCCGDEEKPVDCCTMMRGMFGNASQETDKE